jgi:flagellin
MITINVNSAASRSGINLGNSQEALAASLERLSSGRRIVDPSDDAGGLAVSMKMSAALKRTEATAINLRNARSFLEVQDGSFQVADGVLSRMSELATLANDPTKNAGDIKLYDKEFQNLQLQLTSLGTEKFNGVALFAASSPTFQVSTSEDGSQSLQVTQADITGQTDNPNIRDTIALAEITGSNAITVTVMIQNAIQELASMRAQNGAEMSRVNFAEDMLRINATNLEAANSRIIDVDVAAESTQLARYQILQQAGTAMLAQANTSQQSLVRLLQG